MLPNRIKTFIFSAFIWVSKAIWPQVRKIQSLQFRRQKKHFKMKTDVRTKDKEWKPE